MYRNKVIDLETTKLTLSNVGYYIGKPTNGEQVILDGIQNLNFSKFLVTEYSIYNEVSNSPRIDFLIKTNSDRFLFTEMNGIQHFVYTPEFHNSKDEYLQQQKNFYNKQMYCKNKGIVGVNINILVSGNDYVKNSLVRKAYKDLIEQGIYKNAIEKSIMHNKIVNVNIRQRNALFLYTKCNDFTIDSYMKNMILNPDYKIEL